MEDKPGQSPLDQLENKLERVRAAQEKEQRPERSVSGRAMGLAFRIVTELIIGVVVGAAIGWFLDNQLGTAPWLMICFFALGFVAAVTNIFRVWRREGQ